MTRDSNQELRTTERIEPGDVSARVPCWSRRLVRATQLILNAMLLIVGAWLASSGSRRGLFLLVFVPLVFLPFSYARLRLHRVLESRLWPPLLWTGTAIGIGCDAVMVAQLFDARAEPGSAFLRASGINWVGPVWFSSHALLALAYGVSGLVRRIGQVARRVTAARPATLESDSNPLLSRRELLRNASFAGAALPFGVSVSSVGLSYDFRVEEREMTLPHWPPALDGLRIAHLSDIHVGGAMDHARLQRIADLTNGCGADVVLHTGDFLTHRPGDFDRPLYEALKRVECRYGQWACFGNHDFDDPTRFEERLRASGVTALRNRLVRIEVRGHPLEIGGLDFLFTRSDRSGQYSRLLARWGERGAAPRILLNHDPSAFADLPEGCADLVLSGHTHGGHVGVQLGRETALTVVRLAGYPDQGWYRRGDMRMYVTRCVGFYGYPMRIGIPPEIAVLTLRAPRA